MDDALSRRTKLTYENGCSTNYGFEVDNDMNLLYLSGMLELQSLEAGGRYGLLYFLDRN